MQSAMSLRAAAIVTIITAVLSSAVDACSMPAGWRPISPVEKLLDASEVLFATVLRTFPDHRFDHGGGTSAYSAEIRVHCVLKGHQSDSTMNITEAGHVPGLCHQSNLKVGHRYLILAALDDNVYRVNSAELPADTDEQLVNLTVACGLQPLYPKDVDANKATVKCPTTMPPGKCKSMKDFQSNVTLPPKNGNDDDDYYRDDISSMQTVHVGKSTFNDGHAWRCLPAGVVLCFAVLARWSVVVASSS